MSTSWDNATMRRLLNRLLDDAHAFKEMYEDGEGKILDERGHRRALKMIRTTEERIAQFE
jgi:hypothetical protein